MISKAIFTNVLAVVAMITIASAIPTSNVFGERAASATPNVEVCTGNIGTGCVNIPVGSDACINFTGRLSFLDKESATPNVEVCTGNIGTGCVNIPVGSDACINFTGRLSFLDKESSAVGVPGGFVCSFFADAGCLSPQAHREVTL
ncbi:hypothetical protein CVT25_010607 [Psilocybe cyanescens]|uniref:Hydrophobin n=1 Tax=Psilocybe cyanescens TaxID=93625 RepID=A0A409XUU5_PSICY|nr:hypothetical protein CVT25_010607 [Psilocybe cyanescens]